MKQAVSEEEKARRAELLNFLPCKWAGTLAEMYEKEDKRLEKEEVEVAKKQTASNPED